jgi:hypothetical protein
MRICFIISHVNNSMQWLWFSEELHKRGVNHSFIIINDYKPLIVEDLENINSKVTYFRHKNIFSHFIIFCKVFLYLKKTK